MPLADVNNVLIWLNTDPFIAKHEVQCWEVIVALRQDITLSKLILVSLHLAVELSQEVGEIVARKDYCTCPCVKNRVDGAAMDGIVLVLNRAPLPAIIYRSDREALALGRPEEIVFDLDVLDPVGLLHAVLLGCSKVNERRLA